MSRKGPVRSGKDEESPAKELFEAAETFTPLSINEGRNPRDPLAHIAKPEEAEVIPEDFHVVKELMSPGRSSGELDVRSDINELQMIHMARGRFEAKRFRSKALDLFIDDILRLSVSKGRKGRKEVVQVHQHLNVGDQEAATGVWATMMRNARQ